MTLTGPARALRRAALAAALMVFAACGTMDESGPFAPSFELLQARLSAPQADQAAARASVSPAFVEAMPTSVAFFEAVDPETGAAGLLLNTITGDPGRWTTLQDEVAFLLEGGLPLRTHGLVYDLGGADMTPVLRALARGAPQRITREMRYLDGAYREVVHRFACDIAPEGAATISVFGTHRHTTRFLERCTETGLGPAQSPIRFENRYWRGADGILWRSETWLSPGIGMLRLERLSVNAPP